MKLWHRLYVLILVSIDKAVDIWSTKPYPANVLSNLYPNTFEIDGVQCASMEGFLQSLKFQDINKQREICALSGKDAKDSSTTVWQSTQTVYWQEYVIHRQSQAFITLIKRAYKALYTQNDTFRKALLSTKGKRLYHIGGVTDSYKTILTEVESCSILTELRDGGK